MTFEDMPVGYILVIPSNQPIPWEYCCPCDGRALDRVEHSDLFSVIGITYGAGDGVTTFNIPPKEVLPLMDNLVAIIRIKNYKVGN